MSLVNVVIPVLRSRILFIVDKGRPWSVVEHIILEALTRKAWTAGELASAGNISRRIVVESCARLMRAGWVELLQDNRSMRFRATARGVDVARYDELPSVTERRKRPASYVVDLVAGDVFRSRDWVIHHEEELKDRAKTEPFVWIKAPSTEVDYDTSELIELLLDEDETFVDAEPSGPVRRCAVVAVRDGVIEGFPAGRDLPELKTAVLAAAASAVVGATGTETTFSVAGPRVRVKAEVPEKRNIRFDASDLILGAEAHKNAIKAVFAEARSKIFIHSTFIGEEPFLALLPDMENAIRRGVRIHVFWGQNEDPEEIGSTRAAIINIRRNTAVVGFGPLLIIHPFSTGSHAKLIIADAGDDGRYIATVGSCNWLASGFVSYEASVKLGDPSIVCDVVEYLSQMSCMHGGVWSELATELVGISQTLKRVAPPSSPNAQASVIIGAQHNQFVLRARDEARRRTFVASHKLGPVSSPSIVVPLMTAAKERGIDVEVFYGKTRRPIRPQSARKLAAQAAEVGVALKAIESPRLHAKVLAWDDDAIALSSLNWLSADPTELDSLNEIGVWIEAPDAARTLIDDFHAALSRNGN